MLPKDYMENLNLIEYKPSYAKAIADMWRKSSKGWNGEFGNATEESVLKEMEGSTSINTYLAEKQGEILGYCDFSQYLEDEGALYISLLNVRYDCHGMGIGKTLVSKAVERTVELGWPRLDLYTWPGNKKSIPLYKKCGFFLEDKDDTTHLMNFIPYVLNTEAVSEMFKTINWYKDKKRTINMEPDGRKENGFDFYEYLWEKDGKTLKIEFERNGRGLRLIETEDYIIEAKLQRQDFVFGQSYNICYEIINKSGKLLNIEINGVNNKNIKFDFHKSMEVKNTEKIYGEFYVGEIIEEVNTSKTFPVVESDILINGKKAVYKLGIIPKRPAEISLMGTNGLPYYCNSESHKDVISKIYLDIENSFEEEATFTFNLIENSNIEFLQKEFNVVMKPKEKKSFEVNYILKNNFFYSENMLVTAKLKNEEKVKFNKNLTCLFKGRDGAFGGEAEDYYIIVNGAYSIKQSKLNNKAYVREYEDEDQKTFFDVPKIGEPFTSEFYNIKPKKVTWYKDGEWIVLENTCVSERFKNMEVTTVFKLLSNGLIEHYHKVFNNSENESAKEINLLQGTCHMLSRAVLPINNKAVEISSGEFESIDNFNLDKLTENWIFCQTNKITRGLYWNKRLKPKMADWFIGFQHNLGKIPSKGTIYTEPVKLAVNTFKNWKDFRNFATGNNSYNNMDSVDDLEISINKGNPFVKESFKVDVIENKQQKLIGQFSLSSKNGSVIATNKFLKAEDQFNEAEIMVNRNGTASFDILNMELDLPSSYTEKNYAIFQVKSNSVKEEIKEEQGHAVYSLNNGLINIKASSSFSPALISMTYKEHDWLESSFPTPKAKSWFNPWVGGIVNLPQELSLRTVLEEKAKVEFASLCDNYKNSWRGIKIHYIVNNNEKFNGLEISEHYLLLSGTPVLCHTTEIIQNTGKHMCKENFESMNFFSVDKDIKNNYLMCKNRKGEYTKYKAGSEAMEFLTDSSLIIGSKNLKEKLQIFTTFEKAIPMAFLNTNDTGCFINEKITAANGKKIFTTPVFYIFTEDMIEDKNLKDLRNIHF